MKIGSLLVCGSFLASSAARAEPVYPHFVPVDPDRVTARPDAAPGDPPAILYLNGCFNDGDCVYTPGGDDSRSNHSSILDFTVNLSPFASGPTAWDAVVDCVRRAYVPFNVEVTDQDPGLTPHFEIAVGGDPSEAGMPASWGGVAPFGCFVVDNAVTFAFANMSVIKGSVPMMCWVAAQESAHAFGLDHETLCADPMTYRQDCEPQKWFRDEDAPCGGGTEADPGPRECYCGGSTQNSYQLIQQRIGAGNDMPPEITFLAPADGETVQKGYLVNTDVADDTEVTRVELWINDQMVGQVDAPPYAFSVPSTVPNGRHTVEIRAWDLYDHQSSQTIEVVQGAPCSDAAPCADGQACVEGRCVAGPGTPGGLGESCETSTNCVSGRCAEANGEKRCVEKCDPAADGCPDGFTCENTGDGGVCWGDGGGGGCQTGAGGGVGGALAGWLLAAALLLTGRRPRRRRSTHART